MHDELQHMKNLGKTSAQWLHAVGIHSASDLRRLGAVDAYRAVRARGFRASKVLMYAIEGALLDIHWTLSQAVTDAITESDSLATFPTNSSSFGLANYIFGLVRDAQNRPINVRSNIPL